MKIFTYKKEEAESLRFSAYKNMNNEKKEANLVSVSKDATERKKSTTVVFLN